MANIQDVARAAGVSTASVSRFLSGKTVRSGEAIGRAVRELGYSPSVVARTLKSGRHDSLGVIVPDITNPFFAGLVKGIDDVARPAGFQLILGNSDEDPEQENSLLESFVPRTDGIIIAPLVEEDRSVLGLDGQSLPVVLVDRQLSIETGFDRVVADNVAGSRLAVDHLTSLGHSAIAFISGPPTSSPGRSRRDGFLRSMSAHGLAVRDDYLRLGDFREESGFHGMRALWSLTDRPTAVFVANNLMAIGALKALNDLGVRVPEDVSVISFDDLSFASLLNPPLTVIGRDEREQGRIAARLLLRRLTGDPAAPAEKVTVPVELVIRRSTSSPRSPNRK
ncbi:hypothetical protein GY21_01855 [Cryobacterium roopkundense]|uniref:LacI family transcriptional regulator n=1 Tax=Cryobacterium roopkundense TaxID=1001240 RepID=A0A099JRW5_9MICO|nr:LacI family DNA-binding transcriptional regulator [Cryobacterium roopkundense]KGJ81129.1 hypothetical protein GY21_01855 [Cryobacterium roopkundense]MBB5641871.1 LacI family transcriptional regulator [Cryobacterium roopkundense]